MGTFRLLLNRKKLLHTTATVLELFPELPTMQYVHMIFSYLNLSNIACLLVTHTALILRSAHFMSNFEKQHHFTAIKCTTNTKKLTRFKLCFPSALAFDCGTIDHSFEPHQCLITGMWKRLAQLPWRCCTRGESQGICYAYACLSSANKAAHYGLETQRRSHQKFKTEMKVKRVAWNTDTV